MLRRPDIDLSRSTLDVDGEFLGRQMRRADLRPPADVANADRVRCRAEVECAPIEDPVDRTR